MAVEDEAVQSEGGGPEELTSGEARAGTTRQWLAALVLLAITAAVILPPLFVWQSIHQRSALSLSNMRRLATGCLTYAEDWDQRMPPPLQPLADGSLSSWPRLVRPYVLLDEAFSNPANPVNAFHERTTLHDPVDGHAVQTSYALNGRFWGVFAPGPFPAGNLELPEQTALLVEAGRMAADPRRPSLSDKSMLAYSLDVYGDTTDRMLGASPYPSVHDGQSCLVAADGHGAAVRVLYYSASDGPHDTRRGRIGSSFYNWNGGHPNGETESPARE